METRRLALGTQAPSIAPATEPLDRDALFHQLGPLVGAIFAALLGLAISQADGQSLELLANAATATALTIAAMVIVPWERVPSVLRLTPPLALVVVAVLIRHATGGSLSAYGQLALIPVLWLAAYAFTWEVVTGCAGLAAALCGSLLLSRAGGSEFPSAGLLILEALVLGIGTQRLFTFIRHHQNQLILLAGTDPLTGASNRRGWDDELDKAIEGAATAGGTVSIAMIDVDHFKVFNDARGHQAGDRLLKELVAKWRSQLREGDLLARIGGDEFAIVLPGCPRDPAERIVLRLTDGVPYEQTCSTGIACWNGHESAVELVSRADAALYCSKEAGRNRVTVA